MLTGAIEIKMEKMEILNDIPDDLPFLPSSKMLNASFIIADNYSESL